MVASSRRATTDTAAASGPSVTGIVFSDPRAIDGRWLVAGSDARTLVKIDDAGKLISARGYVTAIRRRRFPSRARCRDATQTITAPALGATGSSFTPSIGLSGAGVAPPS